MTIDEFRKADLRVGKIVVAEPVPNSEKLVRLEVDLGEPERRQIVAGVGRAYSADDLAGKAIVVVANLEPRSLMGIESRGMLLAATDERGEPVILVPDKDVSVGAEVR
ncbi:methionine--tRNA ligase subunit beta [Candidatus Parcubacteria bacterium]|nr:MAG: methionine--tRNA ligase subunit beta [Candidatus Parcubacteria bacterium]